MKKCINALFVLAISVCVLAGLVPETEAGTLPILYVDARDKTGTEIGIALGNAIKAKFPNIEEKLDRYLAYFGSQVVFDYYLVSRSDAIKPNIDQRYRDEVNALASCFALSSTDTLGDGYLSLNELWALQLIPDIARITNCSGFGVFGNYSASGFPIVGRNMDWNTIEDVRSLQAITVYLYEDRTFVNIGFAGLAGVITGYNSDGLFAGILDSPMDGTYPDPPTGRRSYIFDLRNALETCTKISETANVLYNQQYAFSHNILFADTTDIQVLEHPQGVDGLLRTAESQLNNDISWGKSNQIAVVNFFALGGYSNERYEYNTIRWGRLKELANFSTSNKATVNGIESIMLDIANNPYSIFNDGTVQSMVFTPADRKLYLYAVPVSGIHDSSPVMNEIRIAQSIRGDINNDDGVNLADAILALQILSGLNSEGVNLSADVNGDGKVGLAEVIYILQDIAGLR